MTDLVERLRRDLMEISYDDIEAMAVEAAVEIERLFIMAEMRGQEIERLREELADVRADATLLRAARAGKDTA